MCWADYLLLSGLPFHSSAGSSDELKFLILMQYNVSFFFPPLVSALKFCYYEIDLRNLCLPADLFCPLGEAFLSFL